MKMLQLFCAASSLALLFCLAVASDELPSSFVIGTNSTDEVERSGIKCLNSTTGAYYCPKYGMRCFYSTDTVGDDSYPSYEACVATLGTCIFKEGDGIAPRCESIERRQFQVPKFNATRTLKCKRSSSDRFYCVLNERAPLNSCPFPGDKPSRVFDSRDLCMRSLVSCSIKFDQGIWHCISDPNGTARLMCNDKKTGDIYCLKDETSIASCPLSATQVQLLSRQLLQRSIPEEEEFQLMPEDARGSSPQLLSGGDCFRSDWMKYLPSSLRSKPLTQLAIPGSDDSFTFGLVTKLARAAVPSILVDLVDSMKEMEQIILSNLIAWSKSQEVSFSDQLNNGIRYFALRVALDGETFRFVQSVYGPEVFSQLDILDNFLRNHPSEVVILDILETFDLTGTKLQQLFNYIVKKFGDRIVSAKEWNNSPRSLTLSKLAQAEQQLIIRCLDDNVTSFSNGTFWKALEINQTLPADVKNLTKFLENEVNKRSVEDQNFSILQGIVAPDVDYFLQILSSLGGKSLKDLALPVTKIFSGWLEAITQQRGSNNNKINIILAGFVNYHDFVNKVINLNYDAGSEPSYGKCPDWNLEGNFLEEAPPEDELQEIPKVVSPRRLAPDSGCLRSDWMGDLAKEGGDTVPLTQLAIPGSHDTFTFGVEHKLAPGCAPATLEKLLNDKLINYFFGKIILAQVVAYAKCQDAPFLDQLNNGIRFFDLRIARDGEKFYFMHSALGPEVYPQLDILATFLRQHPSEVVILDIYSLCGLSDEKHIELISHIRNKFGSLIAPARQWNDSPSSLTLAKLAQAEQQLIIVYHDYFGILLSGGLFWNSTLIDRPWAETTDLKTLQSFIDYEIKKRPEDQGFVPPDFHILQAVLTPDTDYMVERILKFNSKGLKESLGLPATKMFTERLSRLARQADNRINIAMADFVNYYNFVNTVIQRNFKGELDFSGCPNWNTPTRFFQTSNNGASKTPAKPKVGVPSLFLKEPILEGESELQAVPEVEQIFAGYDACVMAIGKCTYHDGTKDGLARCVTNIKNPGPEIPPVDLKDLRTQCKKATTGAVYCPRDYNAIVSSPQCPFANDTRLETFDSYDSCVRSLQDCVVRNDHGVPRCEVDAFPVE